MTTTILALLVLALFWVLRGLREHRERTHQDRLNKAISNYFFNKRHE